MKQLKLIYDNLCNAYGLQGWWPINEKYSGKTRLNESERFEICLGSILTQNTSWNNVEKALHNLREKNLLSKEKLKLIDIKKLALMIKSSGYNNQKARKIKEFIKFLESKKEINRENLLSVWGVGKETADSILLYAYHKPVFVIDSYTKRIFSRVGFCKEDVTYNNLQEYFHKNLSNDVKLFKEYHALIVEHAKRYCKKTPECSQCPLRKHCDYYRKNTKALLSKN